MSSLKRILENASDKEADEALDVLLKRRSVDELATEAEERTAIIHIFDIQEDVSRAYKSWGKISGLSTGYLSLDARIGGLKNGEVLVVGGDTSTGKSALATNIACNVAKSAGVLYITLEMLKEELGSRVMFINDGRLDNLDLMFQSEHRIDYRDIGTIFKKAKEQGKVSLVILDYLQYLGRGMTNEEVAKMSKEMKTLALEHEVPFIVIASLRKGGAETRYRRKWFETEIEDLMGSGAIGYDADVALITSRKDKDNAYQEDKLFIKMLKTRNTDLNENNRFLELQWYKTKITE